MANFTGGNPAVKCRCRICWSLASCYFALGCAALVHADNWPQWRGPTLDGISTETNLASEWSESKNISWKLALPGMSGATPAVWGERIFLTSEDGEDVVLLCIGT